MPRLVSTAVQAEGGWACLVGGDGTMRTYGLDALIDGYRIKAIQPGRVQLSRNDETVWIEIPRDEKP